LSEIVSLVALACAFKLTQLMLVWLVLVLRLVLRLVLLLVLMLVLLVVLLL
jgi:hypothetical protein